MRIYTDVMSKNPYLLSFPCPDCDGVLTLSTQNGTGSCPICHCSLAVTLMVQKTESAPKNNSPARGWDTRAFRRTPTTSKSAWKPRQMQAVWSFLF